MRAPAEQFKKPAFFLLRGAPCDSLLTGVLLLVTGTISYTLCAAFTAGTPGADLPFPKFWKEQVCPAVTPSRGMRLKGKASTMDMYLYPTIGYKV